MSEGDIRAFTKRSIVFRDEIWTRAAEFKTLQDKFAGQAAAFATAASSGDIARIRAQVAVLGQTCKACHQSFRSDEKH